MGAITHKTVGNKLERVEYESSGSHLVGGEESQNIVRTASYVLAANDSASHVKAQADYICDGVSDQTEINAAINAAKYVYLSEGTFNISNTIIPINGTVMLGSGENSTTIYLSNSSNATMIGNAGSSSSRIYCELGRFKLDGNRTNNTTGWHGIQLKSTFRSRLHDITIQNISHRGIYIQATAPLLNSLELILQNITIYACGKESFRADGNADMNMDDLYIDGASVLTTGSYNAFSFNGGGNDVLRNIHVVAPLAQYGMYFSVGCNGTKVYNGNVDSSLKDCVYVDSDNMVIEGLNAWGGSLDTSDTYNGITITGGYNIVKDCSTYLTTTQKYGIEESGSADYNIFSHNDLRSNLTGGLNKIGAHSVDDNNWS